MIELKTPPFPDMPGATVQDYGKFAGEIADKISGKAAKDQAAKSAADANLNELVLGIVNKSPVPLNDKQREAYAADVRVALVGPAKAGE